MQTSALLPARHKLQDRFDEPWTPKTSLAINALKSIKSAPVQGNPKLANLIWAWTDLDWHRPDLGLLDLSVDDGSNGNLDEILRSFRFSAAASNIQGLFTPELKKTLVGASPTKGKTEDQLQTLETSAIQTENVTTKTAAGEQRISTKEVNEGDSENPIKENQVIPLESAEEEGSNLSEDVDTSPKSKDIYDMTSCTATKTDEKPEILDIEPITPPQVAHNHLGDNRANRQSPDFLNTAGKADDTTSSGRKERPGSCKQTASPRISPKKLFNSTLRKTKFMSSLFTKTGDNVKGASEGGIPDNAKNQISSPEEGSARAPK